MIKNHIKKTELQSLNPTGYERVVKSSERGTLGENNTFNKKSYDAKHINLKSYNQKLIKKSISTHKPC